MNIGSASVAGFLLLLPLSVLEGQVKPLSEAPICEECGIRYEPRVVLGDVSDPGSPGPTAEAGRLPDGRVAISSPTMGPLVLLYGADGTLLRTLGRSGEGPGEFTSAPMIQPVGPESFAFLDARQGVIHRLGTEGELLESTRLGVRALSLAVHPNGYLVSGPGMDGGQITAIHLIDPSGDVSASFAETPSENMRTLVRRMAVAQDGSIWAAPMSGGRLEHWGDQGELLGAYQIQNEDLQREVAGRIDFSQETPPAQIADLVVDDEGHVWVYVVVPDPRFEPGPITGPLVAEDIYDTRILIFDPSEEVVLASQQFDALLRPLGEGWAFELIDTELGDRKVRIGTVVPTEM